MFDGNFIVNWSSYFEIGKINSFIKLKLKKNVVGDLASIFFNWTISSK